MSNTPYFLAHLGLAPDADERAVRRAYAKLLKQIDQEADLAGFQQLRECYETALNWARHEAQAQAEAEAPSQVEEVHHQFEAPTEQLNEEAPSDLIEAETQPSPDIQAQAVFQAFMASMQQNPFGDKLSAIMAMDKSLADNRLVNLDARAYFEWFMAQTLVQGWQPGHEVLFVAATERFDWINDPHRLLRFGRVGHFINNALNERLGYNGQSSQTQEAQRRLIVQLRKPGHPGPSRVIKDLPHLEQLARTFPHWLSIIAPVDKLAEWRAWDEAIPRWRRRLTYQSAVPEIKTKPAKSSGKSPLWLAIFAMMVIGQLAKLGHDTPLRSAESYRRPSWPAAESDWTRPPALPLEALDPLNTKRQTNPQGGLYPNLQAVSGPLLKQAKPKAPPEPRAEPSTDVSNPKAGLNPQFDVGRIFLEPIVASTLPGASSLTVTPPPASTKIDASMPPVDYSLPTAPQ
ncbi:MAG: J domain-containing protein [Rubrivivax sp.]|nr:MAG: J domain-containing protein [Rubrivivax sp.]